MVFVIINDFLKKANFKEKKYTDQKKIENFMG